MRTAFFRVFSSSQCWKTVGNWEELRIFAVWTQHLSLRKLIKTGKFLSFCTLFHWNFEELWNVSERTQWVKPFSKVTNNFRLWVTLYNVVGSTDCQPDRLFSFHYPTVQSIRWGCEQKNRERLSVSSVKKKKNDVSHSLLRKTLSFDSPLSLRKLRGWRSQSVTLLNNFKFSRNHYAAFFLFFSFTDNDVSHIFIQTVAFSKTYKFASHSLNSLRFWKA